MRYALVCALLSALSSAGAIPITVEIAKPEEWQQIGGPLLVGEELATGLSFGEGPVWDFRQQALFFSDIPKHLTLRWSPHEGVRTWREGTAQGNGNAIDQKGRLLTAEHHGRRISVRDRDGKTTTLVDHFVGKRLNSPNDVIVKSDGSVWFTDPDYGIIYAPATGPRPKKEQAHNYVFRYDPSKDELRACAFDFDMPNGLAFSQDESLLYVCDSGKPHHIRVFAVQRDGSLKGGQVFADIEPGFPDGIKTDRFGRVWCTAGDGLHLYTPAGQLIARIRLSPRPSNLCFGGAEGNELFITFPDRLMRIRFRNALIAVPPA